MFYEKKDTNKIIKELTYHIGNIGVDLNEKNKNIQDIDLAAFSYNEIATSIFCSTPIPTS